MNINKKERSRSCETTLHHCMVTSRNRKSTTMRGSQKARYTTPVISKTRSLTKGRSRYRKICLMRKNLQHDRQHSNTQYNQRRKQLKKAVIGLIAGLLQTTAD